MMTEEQVEQFFYKDGKLYLKENPNKELGGLHKGDKYLKFRKFGKLNYVHRVVFQLCTGQNIEGKAIDHIDRNTLNNKIENLRLATVAQNAWNSSGHKDSKTKIKNVSWSKTAKKYHVRLNRHGRRICSVYVDDLELAELVALEAEDQANRIFNEDYK